MAKERTLAIIKPDAVQKGVIGEVMNRMEAHELKIVGVKMLHLNKERAEGFYAVHIYFGRLRIKRVIDKVAFKINSCGRIEGWLKRCDSTTAFG